MYKKVWECEWCGNEMWELVPEQGSTYATAFTCERCDKRIWKLVSNEYFPELKIEQDMAPVRWWKSVWNFIRRDTTR